MCSSDLFSPLFSGDYWANTTDAMISPIGGCGSPVDQGEGVLGFDLNAEVPKTIVFSLEPDLVTKGVSSYNVCWSSLDTFTTRSGDPAVLDSADTTATYYTGTLPDCKSGDEGPCVAFRKSNKYNALFIGVIAPPLDPKGYVDRKSTRLNSSH